MNDFGFLSLIPPLVAITLALLTKEVYSSLFAGIFSGAIIMAISSGNILAVVEVPMKILEQSFGDGDRTNIVIFLALLGVLVVLVTRAGGTKAYAEWASLKIRTRRGVMLSTSALGIMIFIDDYFNCLTVGNLMRPLTDEKNISRAKLAYIIDATAAPICILAPVSSWAVAIGSLIAGGNNPTLENGFAIFLETIPYNLYGILTLVMVISLSVLQLDFGKMKKAEDAALIGEDYTREAGKEVVSAVEIGNKGKIFDLVLPILVLVFGSLFFMLYTGGIFEGASVIDAFNNCNASHSLVLGSCSAIIFTLLLYLPRKVMRLNTFMSSINEGTKSMIGAIILLLLAWMLAGICGSDYLNTGKFINDVVTQSQLPLTLIPPIIFIISAFLTFSTGASWGAFGILIPIVISMFGGQYSQLLVISLSATLAGAVYGDHTSPIADTTILSSVGAECNHIEHVKTQLPYATIVAVISIIGYLFAGLMADYKFSLPITLLFGVLSLAIVFVFQIYKKKRLTTVRK